MGCLEPGRAAQFDGQLISAIEKAEYGTERQAVRDAFAESALAGIKAVAAPVAPETFHKPGIVERFDINPFKMPDILVTDRTDF